MRLAPALAISVSATVCACSLLSSFDGYSGGGTDAGTDGAIGRPPLEAGADVSTEAGGASWCATHAPAAAFCADFDERGLELFDRNYTDNGTYGLDMLASRSPPASLWAAAGSQSAIASAFLAKGGPSNTKRARVAFDLLLEAAHPEVAAELVHLEFASGSSHYTVGFGVMEGGQGAFVYEYSPAPALYEERVISKPVPLGTWVRITLEADLSAKTVTLEREDEPQTATAPLAALFGGALELEIGLAYTTTGQDAWKVRMDNIVLD